MRIAVVGGGPAGCSVSRLLALRGHDITLFDAQGPWEKPCGGGITARSLRGRSFPPALARQQIDRITICFGDRSSVSVDPAEPPVFVSRMDFGMCLLAAAESAGVRFLKGRVRQIRGTPSSWILETDGGRSWPAQFIIGADGATSFVRRSLGTPLASEDLHIAIGFLIPGETDSHMKIFFHPELEGYIWSFPRPDHVSYGLLTRTEPGWTSRSRALLSNYVEADLGPEVLKQAVFYSAPIPALRSGFWPKNQIQGNGWALIGDAAGLVDPITGEGIYYALRSAEILAEQSPNLVRYERAIQDECVPELRRASLLYRHFYGRGFLGRDFRGSMVQLARRSATIRDVLETLVSGTQPYIGLRRRLLGSVPRLMWDLVHSLGR